MGNLRIHFLSKRKMGRLMLLSCLYDKYEATTSSLLASHGPVVDDFILWCENAFLQLNVTKTKDMCIDFRRSPPAPQNSVVKGEAVEIVSNYKYLGTVIDNNLKFNCNTEALCKKGQQRLFCLRKLARFQIDKSLMSLFYSAFIESVLSFSIICWYGNLGTREKNALDRIVKVASKIVGVQFTSLNHIFTRQALKKAVSIQSHSDHPLSSEYHLLPSGQRLRVPTATKNRYKNSFIPVSIRALNDSCRR